MQANPKKMTNFASNIINTDEKIQIDCILARRAYCHRHCPVVCRIRPTLEGAAAQSVSLFLTVFQATDGRLWRHALLHRYFLYPVFLLSLDGCPLIMRLVATAHVADQTGILYSRQMDCLNTDTNGYPPDKQHGSGLLDL